MNNPPPEIHIPLPQQQNIANIFKDHSPLPEIIHYDTVKMHLWNHITSIYMSRALFRSWRNGHRFPQALLRAVGFAREIQEKARKLGADITGVPCPLMIQTLDEQLREATFDLSKPIEWVHDPMHDSCIYRQQEYRGVIDRG